MPYVSIRILEGATREQKKALVADVTRSLVERLGKRPETIHVVIDDVAADNWGFAGALTSDAKRRSAGEDAVADSEQ